MKTVTRFAPSPNGHLHLGHAFAAIFAHDFARDRGGDFLLRIEDIDGPRSKGIYADECRRDLEWLGLEWFEVPPQSSRIANYAKASETLQEKGLLYPCSCNRREIERMPRRQTPEGVTYPGTCKGRPLLPDEPTALRLDVDEAMSRFGDLIWIDECAGSVVADPREFGDPVIVRRELPASYHLAATIDDAHDGVTDVTRGMDLFSSTHIHRFLQEMLGLPVPHWHHHRLILDEDGEKLSKRRNSASLADRRLAGEDGRALAAKLRAL